MQQSRAVCLVMLAACGRLSQAFVLTGGLHTVTRGGRPSLVSFSTKAGLSLRMGIYEDVSTRVKEAMKGGPERKKELLALRMIRSAFLNETKAAGNVDSLPDDKCYAILRKLAKQREESIDLYKKGNRPEQAAAEEDELAIISAYLPTLANEESVTGWAKDAVAASGAKGPADMGKVMGLLMKQHKDEMDGNMAKRIVSGMLKAM